MGGGQSDRQLQGSWDDRGSVEGRRGGRRRGDRGLDGKYGLVGRAGIAAIVLLPAGTVASGKVAQSRMYGALVLEVAGSFDEALAAARELAGRGSHVLVNSINPYRREGQKTAVFEIVEELGGVPDAIYLPYGGGGNTTAYGQGFADLGGTPARLVAAEARDRAHTLATAIRIADPVHSSTAAAAIEQSGGAIVTLDDSEILAAWADLARTEGLFCEPSSAAGLAALGHVRPAAGERVVVVITGHGLKDPASADQYAPPPLRVAADPDAIAEAAAR
jgi:threonine synthase